VGIHKEPLELKNMDTPICKVLILFYRMLGGNIVFYSKLQAIETKEKRRKMKWEKVNEVEVYARDDATQSKGVGGKGDIDMVQECQTSMH
jgi:hypothetical protein